MSSNLPQLVKQVNKLAALQLSPRERDVIRLFALGMKTDEAGAYLKISANTARKVAELARRKLRAQGVPCRNRSQLTLYAIKSGLITVEVLAIPLTRRKKKT